MHTKASTIYRQCRITGHDQQCYAALMVMRYLLACHYEATLRHKQLVMQAIEHMEERRDN